MIEKGFNFFKTKAGAACILLLLLLPLFFINTQNTHDWGDDFAAYVQEAKNIAEGEPAHQLNFIFNPAYPLYSPRAYPAGFPLLISPVYAIWGLNIQPYLFLITLFLVATTIILFFVFCNYFSLAISLLLSLAFAYNPFVLQLKAEVLSEIPFAFFVMLFIFFYKKENMRLAIISGIIAGFVSNIRLAGFFLPVAVAFDLAVNFFFSLKDKNRELFKKSLIRKGTVILITIGVFFLINTLIFSIPLGYFSIYKTIYTGAEFKVTLWNNLQLYKDIILIIFPTFNTDYAGLSTFLSNTVFYLSILGLVRCLYKKDFIAFVFLFYFIILVLYPYGDGAIRFLIPVLPLLILFAAHGLTLINYKSAVNNKIITFVILVVFIVPLYQPFLTILEKQKAAVEGPYEESAQQAFNVIVKNTTPDDVIAFKFARALGLYADRKTLPVKPHSGLIQIDSLLNKFNVNYIMVHNTFTDDSVKKYVEVNALNKLWENEKFRLYKRF